MILTRIFRTYTFRYTLFYITALSVTVFILLCLLYGSFSYGYFNEVHSSITNELDNLHASYEQGGIEGVRAYVEKKNAPGSFNKFYYMLVDEDYKLLAGNHKEWPKFRTYVDGWLSFELDVLQIRKPTTEDFVGRSRSLDNGYHLLVARHYNDVIDRIKLVAGTLSQSMIVTILLGVLGAALISADMLRRVDSMNKSIQTIMSGDLSERIPMNTRGGDFDRLGSNLNRMLDRIQELMEGMRRVSDNIAHDLRTPLTRLRNNLSELERVSAQELVDNKNADAQAVEQRLDIIQNLIGEADSLLSTFNALLRIAQVEAGNRRAGFDTVDLSLVVGDIVELYEPLAHDKDISVESDIEAQVSLSGDRDLLFQMLANLIDNAIKYTPQGGRIWVKLTEHGGTAYLDIADSGIGIPQEDRDKVFQRFYRVEASRGKEPGNGLGLSLVSAVVKLHAGSVTLEDNNPGLRVKLSLANAQHA